MPFRGAVWGVRWGGRRWLAGCCAAVLFAVVGRRVVCGRPCAVRRARAAVDASQLPRGAGPRFVSASRFVEGPAPFTWRNSEFSELYSGPDALI